MPVGGVQAKDDKSTAPVLAEFLPCHLLLNHLPTRTLIVWPRMDQDRKGQRWKFRKKPSGTWTIPPPASPSSSAIKPDARQREILKTKLVLRLGQAQNLQAYCPADIVSAEGL